MKIFILMGSVSCVPHGAFISFEDAWQTARARVEQTPQSVIDMKGQTPKMLHKTPQDVPAGYKIPVSTDHTVFAMDIVG